MGKIVSRIDRDTAAFLADQHVFFVATAPRADDGHVNLSPKGLDTFAVLDETTVAYEDLVGSGAETAAHVRENGRITLLFCAFQGPPRIVRLYGRATLLEPGDEGYASLAARLPSRGTARTNVRALFRIDVARVANSCGYGVPLMEHRGERSQLDAWAAQKGPAGTASYVDEENRVSIDGLPALRGTPQTPR